VVWRKVGASHAWARRSPRFVPSARQAKPGNSGKAGARPARVLSVGVADFVFPFRPSPVCAANPLSLEIRARMAPRAAQSTPRSGPKNLYAEQARKSQAQLVNFQPCRWSELHRRTTNRTERRRQHPCNFLSALAKPGLIENGSDFSLVQGQQAKSSPLSSRLEILRLDCANVVAN